MKKLFYAFSLVFFICLSCQAFAQDYEGYIFKIDNDSAVLLSDDSNITYLGDGLYMAESREDIYSFFNEDDILTLFPNYCLELHDTDYPFTTSDSIIDNQWNLEITSAASAREKGISGKNVKIAILDSGL